MNELEYELKKVWDLTGYEPSGTDCRIELLSEHDYDVDIEVNLFNGYIGLNFTDVFNNRQDVVLDVEDFERIAKTIKIMRGEE